MASLHTPPRSMCDGERVSQLRDSDNFLKARAQIHRIPRTVKLSRRRQQCHTTLWCQSRLLHDMRVSTKPRSVDPGQPVRLQALFHLSVRGRWASQSRLREDRVFTRCSRWKRLLELCIFRWMCKQHRVLLMRRGEGTQAQVLASDKGVKRRRKKPRLPLDG